MLHTEVVRAVLVGVLAGLAFMPQHALSTGVWLAVIYVTVFMENTAGQFFGPARLAILGEIVPGDVDRARASGIEQATQATAAILGPPLAAPLLFTAGIQWALVLNALSYVVSYVAIRSVRTIRAADEAAPERAHGSFRSDFVAGLKYFSRSQLLVTLLVMAVIAQLGTGALGTLDIFFLTRNLHSAPRLYGLLSTAFGVGAVIGGLASGRVVRWIGARTLMWAGAAVAGALVLVYARQTVFTAALALILLVALTVTLLNTAWTPLLLKAAPPEYLGRVVAVFMPVNTLSSMLSMAAAGWLASSALRGLHGTVLGVHIGPIDTIWTIAALLMIAAGGYGMLALPREAAAAPAEVASEPA
jgi:MFS family permease